MWLNKFNKVMAAVSGGPDSMCLLDYYKNKIAVVCHVNYHKRESSIRDEKIVREYCKKNNLKLEVLNVTYDSNDKKVNFQAHARKIRYDFFVKIGNKYKINKIYIAHNFNDFLESAYMQKRRSKKILFYGIRKKSSYQDLEIFRPLLMMQRTWIENYCQKNNVNFGIDETNSDFKYERNKVRFLIKSWLKDEVFRFKQEVIKHNLKNKKTLDKVNKFFIMFKFNGYDLDFFRKLDKDIQYHIIYLFLINHNFGSSNQKINAIIDFINIKSQKEYRLSRTSFLKIKNNNLKIIEE